MKSTYLTPTSTVKSSSTITSTPTSLEYETRDGFYFPKCRRDANCNCDSCIDNINATLDLMPQSIGKSSFTILSASRPSLPRTPIPFNPSAWFSPSKSKIRRAIVSRLLDITEGMSSKVNVKRNKKEFEKNGTFLFRLILILSFYWAAEYGFSKVPSGILQSKLTPDLVKNFGEKSLLVKDLNERFFFSKKEVSGMVDKDFTNRSYVDFLWEIDQDGLLLNSRIVLHRSMTEKVSIWGWPLQTAGFLTLGFSSRSFIILSGRLTEWKNGEVNYSIRNTNSSWVQEKWSASAVQLDPYTWILEYRQRSIMVNTRFISTALQLLKFKLLRESKKTQQEFWLLSAFGSKHRDTEWSYKKLKPRNALDFPVT